jgi:transposase
MEEKRKLGKFAILSNMRTDPWEIYDPYKSHEEVEVAFNAIKNERGNDKTYIHTKNGLSGYFFISLYMYFSIIQVLKDKDLSQKMSVKEVLFELSQIYVIFNEARRTVS